MFDQLKAAVAAQFKTMAKNDLMVVDSTKNELFDAYLAAFPENERQEHNCNCCKAFFNQYGSIVTINDGVVKTVWDVIAPDEYAAAIAAVKALVLSKEIDGPFLSTFAKLGTDSNMALLADGKTKRWTHFFVELPKEKVHRGSDSIAKIVGNQKTTQQVFKRALETITKDSVDTVIDLISQNALYRGAEFKKSVEQFSKQKEQYLELVDGAARSLFVWSNYREGGRIRNSPIGTLLVDLSNDTPLERAVASYEHVVAPANFRRSTALVTPQMIKGAQAKIDELGYKNSLARRRATVDDIPLEHLKFVNRESAAVGDVFAQMEASAPTTIPSKIKTVNLDEFVNTVLTNASNVQLFLENGQNFVSLIAPVDNDAPSMFSWGNGISWTYQNNQTDVIKEKVKSAGGSITGELRVSLEWFNYDDLDLYVKCPSGVEISYSRTLEPKSGGNLDVDMNRGAGSSKTPVENIVFPTAKTMAEGIYTVSVHNFSKRENVDLGFNVQIECQGVIHNLSHPKAIPGREMVVAATFKYTRAGGITDLTTELSSSQTGREIASLMTNKLQKVNMITFSPNHWTDEKGNKHLFVILDGAKIEEPLRPFFNEYLSSDLMEHRKVLELLGNKLMIEPSADELSGVGISLTQAGSSLTFKVDNKFVKVVI